MECWHSVFATGRGLQDADKEETGQRHDSVTKVTVFFTIMFCVMEQFSWMQWCGQMRAGVSAIPYGGAIIACCLHILPGNAASQQQ